jgi:hypothetical protein
LLLTWQFASGVVEGVVQVMERFVGALSLTLMLTGLKAIAQVQPAPVQPLQVQPAPVQSQNPIDQVVEAGLMSPFPDGDFRADVVLSRAELAAILVKTFHLEQRKSGQAAVVQIQDVPPSYWAYNDIQVVLRNGIMTGYREGRFFPDQRVTRAEAFSIFAQAYGVFQFPDQTVAEILARYPDASEIPGWARKSMATALYEGFINTKENNRIDPLNPMTRGDMAYALSIYLLRQRTPADPQWKLEMPPGG